MLASVVNFHTELRRRARLHSRRADPWPPLSFLSPSILSAFLSYLPSRDEKPVTATPLECALTNRDVCKSFRIRFYANCWVSPTIPCSSFFPPSLRTSNQPSVVPFFSYTYELPNLQVLCFHIHACNGRCTPPWLESSQPSKKRSCQTETRKGGEGDRSQGCTDPRGRTLHEDQACSASRARVTSG